MDSVFIEGLRIETWIGIHAHEQARPQPLLIDVDFDVDSRAAAASDRIGDALDYAEVCEAVRGFAAGRRDQLLETFGAALADVLQRRFAPRRIALHLRKPDAAQALGCDTVGVRIVRDGR